MKLINGKILRGMILSGSNNLTNQKDKIDALNVFPVPDGDTGTNMSLTFSNGLNEVNKLNSDDLSAVSKTLSRGLLMGARGNSGVILSQIFRGFYQAVEGKSEINGLDVSIAFNKGAAVAYKAVMRPVEGTILTVIRESAYYANKYAEENVECTINEYFDVLTKEAMISLENTPELLPVLKEVGVVDSGATGLIAILDGFKAYIDGSPIELLEKGETAKDYSQHDIKSDEFGYCTEFIVRLNEKYKKTFDEARLTKQLSKLGDSLVVVQDDDLVKVHVHTLTPGDALNLAQRYGEFIKLKIENMQEQHSNIVNEKKEEVIEEDTEKEYAIIAVAAGEGLKNIFKEYRVDVVISGGQTMNPSTEDFTAAIKQVKAKHIFILPNNSNIILAAQQAAMIIEDEDIHVFETKSIPQGLSACLMFNPEVSVEDNLHEMNAAIENVLTGQVTYAIKDTSFDGIKIEAGDYMGIKEKEIVYSTKDIIEATKKLLDSMISEESEIATLIYGENISEDQVNEIVKYIQDNFGIEIDVQNGGQPVYSFIIGIE
ncbi:MAG: DAK2 domain-containing protein [Erysipelotrichaceae bacterium]|nr:DAK2 domain-containing protein [Erysipelotrichaceae bacterium]